MDVDLTRDEFTVHADPHGPVDVELVAVVRKLGYEPTVLGPATLPPPPRVQVPMPPALHAALQQAQGKPLLVIVGATWCRPCQQMHRDVWPQVDVTRFVRLDVDADTQPDIAEHLGIVAVPEALVLGAQGQVRARLQGWHDATSVQAWLASLP